MGEAISKEVKELAEKTQALLPRIKFETSSDKLPEIDLTNNAKEISASLNNIAQKIRESNQVSNANLEKKIFDTTTSAISALQKKTVESTGANLAVLSKKIVEVAADSAAKTLSLEKRLNESTTNSLSTLTKKIGDSINGRIGELQKKIGEQTAAGFGNLEKEIKLDVGFDVTMLDSKIGQSNEAITALQKKFGGNHINIEKTLQKVFQRIPVLEKKVGVNHTNIERALQSVKDQQANLQKLTAIESRLSQIANQGNTKKLMQMDAKINASQDRFRRFAKRVIIIALIILFAVIGYQYWNRQTDETKERVRRIVKTLLGRLIGILCFWR